MENKTTVTQLKTNIAIFASGGGSNAKQIIEQLPGLTHGKKISISLIVTNKSNAGIIDIAKNANIPLEILDVKNENDYELTHKYLQLLKSYQIDLIVLAGYLKKIPFGVIKQYPHKIVNIHPSLLPKYGGAGMYGAKVHNAVIAAQEKQSGITIHYVDEVYDNGKIIFQTICDITKGETGESLAKKVLALEHSNYAKIIAGLI